MWKLPLPSAKGVANFAYVYTHWDEISKKLERLDEEASLSSTEPGEFEAVAAQLGVSGAVS